MNSRLVRYVSGWRVFGVSVVCALALGASPASAVVIDFESLLSQDDPLFRFQGFSYSEDGFTLLSDPPSGGLGLWTSGTLAANFYGSTAMYTIRDGGVIELALTGGGSFSLSSIDLVEQNGPFVIPVTFIGTLTSGTGEVAQTFTLDGDEFGAETFTFTGFGNVTKVSWTQLAIHHQFDNIVASATNAVPEPASLGLLGLGLAALAWTRRRTRS